MNMERTQAELGLEELLETGRITTYEKLEEELLRVLDEVCGDCGIEEFTEYVLPQLAEVYGNNHRAAGLEALRIIDKGAQKTSREIGDYFRTALQEKLKKKLHSFTFSLFGIELTINSLIHELDTQHRKEFGTHYNICGAILFGSWVRGNNHPESDLDVFYLTREPNNGFVDDFSDKLSDILKLPIDNFHRGRKFDDALALREILYGENGVVKGQFKVCSPYAFVHAAIKQIADG